MEPVLASRSTGAAGSVAQPSPSAPTIRSRSPETRGSQQSTSGRTHKFLSPHSKLVEQANKHMAAVQLEEVVAGKVIGQELNQMRRVKAAFEKARPGCAELVTLTSALKSAEDAQMLAPSVIMSLHKQQRLELFQHVCPLLERQPDSFKVQLLHCAVRDLGILDTADAVKAWMAVVGRFAHETGPESVAGK